MFINYRKKILLQNMLLLLGFLMLSSSLFAQSYLPASSGQLVEHTYFTLAYAEEHEQAEWVYYTLSPETLAGDASRGDNFREDGKIVTGSATLNDYKASGYDRGHLCPAASMSRNEVAMSESFYLSNMSPQLPSFNRGGWKRLEERVRDLALRDSVLHVITGPILADSLGSIGENCVTIPGRYYKVLYSPKKQAMIGYVMENSKVDGALEEYAVSVDLIEELTSIDFFAEMSEELQAYESSFDSSVWLVEGEAITVTATSEVGQSDDDDDDDEQSDQCQGVTSSGVRCKRTAQSGSKYCWQHQKNE